MLVNHLNKLKLLYVIIFIMINKTAFAIDLQPGDIKAPSGSFNAAQISYLFVEKGDKYTHGTKSSDISNIKQNAMLLRLDRALEIGRVQAYAFIQSSFNYLENKNLSTESISIPDSKSNGVGDTSLAFAFWPYANREKDEYFAVAGYLLLPTGDYDRNRAINSGLNIYQGAIQTGYQRKIASNINWTFAIDSVFSSDNKQYFGSNKLARDALYNLQTGFQYIFNPTYSISLGYFYTIGGETTLNGVDNNDITKIHRYQLTGQANYSFGRLTLHYGSEISNENSYIEDHRLITRYSFKF